MANSAPGKDRLEYRHLHLLDPQWQILSKVFRHCFLAKDVPASWKTATTILIHKKGSTTTEGCYEHAFLLESIVNDASPPMSCLAGYPQCLWKCPTLSATYQPYPHGLPPRSHLHDWQCLHRRHHGSCHSPREDSCYTYPLWHQTGVPPQRHLVQPCRQTHYQKMCRQS